ncbi:MAG: hypothetical protein KF704_15030 [Crocinitomicaceae bacterium]|nr:hypothetical protein [Crocinitomicaceae bacterium]NGF74672.1 hypothetical protein [Fluviicola sp. SGL-29]
MQERQLYIQIFSNLLIPVLGFWLWGWSLYFIVLFYILDILSSEVVVYLKSKKIREAGKKETVKSPVNTYKIISGLFLVATIAFIQLGIMLIHPEIRLQDEIRSFLTYKEMGIQQGFLLIPLVVLMAFSSYKIEFLVPKVYLREEQRSLWKFHLKERFLLITFCAILTFIATGFQFQEWVILTVILAVTSGYTYLQGKERIGQFTA